MFKSIFIILFLFLNVSLAKEISIPVLASPADVNADMNEEQLLVLNGYRQSISGELTDLKLDSELFWSKLEEKKMSSIEEAAFLKVLFDKDLIAINSALDPKAPLPEGAKLSGHFTSSIDLEKLNALFLEVTLDLAATKLKTFYLLANIDLDTNMTWEDAGVQKPESFRSVILDSWKKLIEKDVLGFEKTTVLEKEISIKPDYMNSKSVSLKWTSTFKKVSSNLANHTANYELSAHYVLQNTKSGAILHAFDFPLQKREFEIQNKKMLSSSLASLVYNLLLSQSSKINSILEADSKSLEASEIEIKIITKTGLSEISQINSYLQDKFKDIKLTSQMKSYSSDSSVLVIRALGNSLKILDSLSVEGGKFQLNEQKVLLFNRTDKTFAILPKASNN